MRNPKPIEPNSNPQRSDAVFTLRAPVLKVIRTYFADQKSHQYYVLTRAFSYQRSTRRARSVIQRLGSPTDSPNLKASALS
jgi:hypothetical protein